MRDGWTNDGSFYTYDHDGVAAYVDRCIADDGRGHTDWSVEVSAKLPCVYVAVISGFFGDEYSLNGVLEIAEACHREMVYLSRAAPMVLSSEGWNAVWTGGPVADGAPRVDIAKQGSVYVVHGEGMLAKAEWRVLDEGAAHRMAYYIHPALVRIDDCC